MSIRVLQGKSTSIYRKRKQERKENAPSAAAAVIRIHQPRQELIYFIQKEEAYRKVLLSCF
jgi:hypothetical protein